MEKVKDYEDLEALQIAQRDRMISAGESTTKLLEHYKDIAPKYDQFTNLEGWMEGRREIAAILFETIPDAAHVRILDCGCGTGHTALEIKQLGFENIDGLDMSPDMLEVAKEKGLFKNVICGKISGEERSDIQIDTYDAVICNGVFVPGQMDQRCFPELTRITKSGGHIIFSVSQKYLQENDMFANGRLDEAIEQCISSGKWTTVKKEVRPYWRKEDAVIYVARVA